MKAVILAGGKGTRLRPYTTVIPKPLMPVGEVPILEIIIRQLKSYDIDEVFLAVGYMSQLFQAFFNDGRKYGLAITYSQEEKPLGTAGPIANILKDLSETFIVLNGDTLTTLNYQKMIDFHLNQKAAATIGLNQRDEKIDFGVVKVDGDHNLVEYIEKPTNSITVSMGVNVFNREHVASYLTPGDYLDIPDLLRNMKRDGLPVKCYQEDCYWLDIGRIEDYQIANEVFESRRNEFLRKP
jgi:NDP-sugar pyrophosphorylase family protein